MGSNYLPDYNCRYERGDSIRYRWPMENPYLSPAGYLTSTLGSCPANIWASRNFTQAAQGWTHCAAFPYGFNLNFTGRRNQYVVANAFEMPYEIALGLHTGQTYTGMGAAGLSAYFAQRNARFCVNISATKTASNLQQAKSIGACKDYDYMKAEENKALREEVIEIEKKAEELLKQFEEAMKDADKLSTSELDAKIKVYSEAAATLVGKSDDLYKRVKEAEKAYAEAKVKEAEEKAKEDAGKTGSGDDAGEDPAKKSGTADETKRQEGTPPEVKTSAKKSEVKEKGTKLEKGVKGKADGQQRTGTFYEYEGRIYQILASEPEPKDVTDEVEKITT